MNTAKANILKGTLVDGVRMSSAGVFCAFIMKNAVYKNCGIFVAKLWQVYVGTILSRLL